MFKKIPFVLGQGGRRDVAKCIYVRPADLHLDSCRGVFLEEPSVYGTGHPHVMTLHVQCAGYISIVDEHRLNPLVNTAVNFREGPRYYVYLSLSFSLTRCYVGIRCHKPKPLQLLQELEYVEFFAGAGKVHSEIMGAAYPSTAIDIEYLKGKESGRSNPFDFMTASGFASLVSTMNRFCCLYMNIIYIYIYYYMYTEYILVCLAS
jgi:hypothetical protein